MTAGVVNINNEVKLIIILLCLAMTGFLGGFYISASSASNVFIGLFVMGIGTVFALLSAVPAIMLMQRQNKRKEERIEKLEQEIEILKKRYPSKNELDKHVS